jgi:hypothetical protein
MLEEEMDVHKISSLNAPIADLPVLLALFVLSLLG